MTTLEPADLPLLVGVGVYRRFYGVHALSGADLEVRESTSIGLIGPNGAGESTLLKAIAGLLKPSRGQIRFRDRRAVGSVFAALAVPGLAMLRQRP